MATPTPLEFIAAVLPSSGHGYYCAIALSEGSHSPKHEFTEHVTDLEPRLKSWLANKLDVYFAPCTFKDDNSRKANNAQFVKAFFIDMDGYASKAEAATVLGEFLDKTGLSKFGTPWIVSSGGGLHCYWPLREEVPISLWKPAAENFKRLCLQEGMRIDMTVTADAARVLRIPGSYNYKKKYATPRPVKLLTDTAPTPIEFEEFAALLRSKLNGHAVEHMPASTMMLEGTPLKLPPSAAHVQLLSNSNTFFKNILTETKNGRGCAQLTHYVENASEEGMEPLWRAWLSIAKPCEDGEKAARWLTKLHPYTEERMQQKLHEIKGPYPCSKFDSENPGVCIDCPHNGAITNPLALGREIEVDNAVKEIVVPHREDDDPNAPPLVVFRPPPPKTFDYGANGGVFRTVYSEDATGTKSKRQVMVLPYDMFVIDLLHNDEGHIVHMLANRPGKPIDVLVPQRAVVGKDDLLKTLAQQNIIGAFGSTNDKHLFDYVRACVEEASISKKAIRIPSQYGWQEDYSFVYNGRVYYPSGEERSIPMPDLANITRATRHVGTLEAWKQFPNMLIRRELDDMLAIMCIGFGSPLMSFTGLSALTFHAGSTESGTGKSLTLSALASIWGHPARYRVGKSTSAVTMQQRCGNLNNLPFVSDEITHKSRHDMEWFPGLVFDLSEGQGKEKSDAYVNKERMNNVSWALLSLLTSNMHMQDYMSGARKHSSQGELFRMLEWTPKQALNWSEQETRIIKSLNDNYGVAGERWVKWLVQNRDTAMRITSETIEHLKRKWKMSGDERFWAAGCGCVVASAIMVSSKHAGIVDLPVENIINSLYKMVEKARGVIRTSVRSADDVLNAYTRENYGQFVVIQQIEGKIMASMGDDGTIDQSITRSKIMGRVEKGFTPGCIDYFIEETMLKAHCVALSYGYDDFRRQIADKYTVRFTRKDMTAKSRGGPQMRVRAMHICRRIRNEEDSDAAALSVGTP